MDLLPYYEDGYMIPVDLSANWNKYYPYMAVRGPGQQTQKAPLPDQGANLGTLTLICGFVYEGGGSRAAFWKARLSPGIEHSDSPKYIYLPCKTQSQAADIRMHSKQFKWP